MKKKDLIFIGIVLVIALLSLLAFQWMKVTGAELQVVITIDGDKYRSLDLTEEVSEEIVVDQDGKINVVQVSNGQVTISEANCPDQICVHTAPADEHGEMIVCLPHKVIVEVTKNNGN